MNAEDVVRILEPQLKESLTTQQVKFLLEISAIYETENVLRGSETLPLQTACACGAACWRTLPEASKPRPDGKDRGEMLFPWVGQHYQRGGVVSVPINMRSDGRRSGGLHVDFRVAGEQLRALSRGDKRIHGSNFAYQTTKALVHIDAWARGEPVPARAALRSAARIDTQKDRPSGVGEVLTACPGT